MRYEFWIDRGGTFTDCICLDRTTGQVSVTKVLSSDNAPLLGIRELLGLKEGEPIPPSTVRMGTTVATNALLERRGAKTAMVITRGFRDVFAISDQTRPDLFALNIERPSPLCASILETSARLAPDGAEIAWPEEEETREIAKALAEDGIESVALVLLHGYAAPLKEQQLRDELLAAWPKEVSPPSFVCSTEATSEQGLLGRASTAVLDAYITPLLARYLERLAEGLPGSELRLMQSSGGLAGAHRFRGPEAILSGPAGGVVAARAIAKKAGVRQLVTFDMGGTSTDVALIDEEPALKFETRVGGVFLHSKMLDIHTIAAGGGSECTFNGYALSVGPRSVGADPGPLCYGKQAGESPRISLTDVNLVLGRLAGDHFSFPLDEEASKSGLEALAKRVEQATEEPTSIEDLGRGFSAVATANMAEAIRTVTVERGVDVQSLDLLVFGGAAGQHACALARSLGIRKILVHRLSGVLSAYGIGQADEVWSSEADAGRVLVEESQRRGLDRRFVKLEEEGRAALSEELTANARGRNAPLQVTRTLALRYRGTESTLSVLWGAWGQIDFLLEQFHEKHQQRFGYARREAEVEAVAARVEIRIVGQKAEDRSPATPAKQVMPKPLRLTRVVLERRTADDVPVYDINELSGAPRPLLGPALLLDRTGTYLLEDEFQARLQGDVLSISVAPSSTRDASASYLSLSGAARTQILATRFAAIAAQMGEALRKSASSTNIRDRLDYSCAVFDDQGRLVANAPHIPVHLGAMSESVAAVLRAHPRMQPGDAFVTNDPALGGSHLPDITVVTPVFSGEGDLVGFTASRGHHADVGGIEPGSMPAFSKSLAEEGVVLSALKLVERGRLLEREIKKKLKSGPYPARKPAENLADLKAQLAANQLGSRLLLQFGKEIGLSNISRAMDAVRNLSERWMKDALQKLPDQPLMFSDRLDDGLEIRVKIEKEPGGLHIDFTGTSPESDSNLNAPKAVTLAAVLYVLRVYLRRPLPLNQGCLSAVRVTIPEPSLLAPSPGRAVAAGNVETSQRVVDVLLGALGLAAASQGTMNNLTFGNGKFGYYETIAGGAGAGPHFSGASGVHTHMTNTRITDAEILEDRFPVRLEEFSIRLGSGGDGKHRGGDGVSRRLTALEPLQASLLSERRVHPPFGLAGGKPGSLGRNSVGGEEVGGKWSGTLQAGQTICVETPGGGGFGGPE